MSMINYIQILGWEITKLLQKKYYKAQWQNMIKLKVEMEMDLDTLWCQGCDIWCSGRWCYGWVVVWGAMGVCW